MAYIVRLEGDWTFDEPMWLDHASDLDTLIRDACADNGIGLNPAQEAEIARLIRVVAFAGDASMLNARFDGDDCSIAIIGMTEAEADQWERESV